jgi:Holliday junction DNA helicase RuvA
MIGRLRGTLAHKGAAGVVIDVGGVGYDVAMSPRGIGELPPTGEEAVVHTHLHVREDQMALFGFGAEEERDLFRILLGASGVGPRLAMAVLGTLRPDELRRAVLTEDTASLTAVPGIGKRSAQKLVLELRARFEMPDALPQAGTAAAEAREALEALGYQAAEIREALDTSDAEATVEVLVREALRKLGGRG